MSENQDQFNRGGFYAFLFSMVFVFAFMMYLVGLHPGVSLNENVVDPKAAPEAGQAPQFNIADVKEPWVSSPELVTYGQKLFQTNCAMCHGPEGKGDGPAGAGLNPKPRNLVAGGWKKGAGAIAHYQVLQEGLAGSSMASYAHLKSADRWAMVHYIESITQDKGENDPVKIAEFAKTAK